MKIETINNNILEYKGIVNKDIEEFKKSVTLEIKSFLKPIKNIYEVQNKIENVF